MSGSQKTTALLRKSFGKIRQVVSLPDLIEVQSKSYNDFIQFDYLPNERAYIGLEKVLRDIFPIDYNGRIALEYVSYEIGEWACVCGVLTGIENRYRWVDLKTKKEGKGRLPKDAGDRRYKLCKKCSSRVSIKLPYTVEECRYSGKTYSLPLKVRMQLTSWDVNDETNERIVRDIKEQEVFFCDLPVMIDLHEDADGQIRLGNQGTFLINGVDRVVVSQIHRAPGVVFSLSKKIKDFRGYPYHVARLIPSRGSWLDFEFDSNDLLYVRIDKKKKVLATTFLQAIGYAREEILPLFYDYDTVKVTKKGFERPLSKVLIGQRIEAGAIPDSLSDKFSVGQRITQEMLDDLKAAGVKSLSVRANSVLNRVAAKDVVNAVTGEVLVEQGKSLGAEEIDIITDSGGVSEIELVRSGGYVVPPFMALTLGVDKINNYADALREVYYRLRPGDIPTIQIMEEYIKNIFFNSRFYDMTLVGRIR
ncbi:MAG: DNA-directed polymerase subunit beta, partial [Candidatus Dependentiae bacterium]|nr:DNA-directed polymerase subunit beta [Candidatus Dependentiae bacterium]